MAKTISPPPDERTRCGWCVVDPIYMHYHDEEWGIAIHDDRLLFEFLILEGFQAGLSWLTILRKRENFRRAFDQFDAAKIVHYTDKKVEALMQDEGIIRNRLKIQATITNAKIYLATQQEFGTFDQYLWNFTDGKTIVNRRRSLADIPATTPISDAMSKDMKKRGFKFCGSTICYALIQAVGMVDDHIDGCWRRGSEKNKS